MKSLETTLLPFLNLLFIIFCLFHFLTCPMTTSVPTFLSTQNIFPICYWFCFGFPSGLGSEKTKKGRVTCTSGVEWSTKMYQWTTAGVLNLETYQLRNGENHLNPLAFVVLTFGGEVSQTHPGWRD